MATIFNVKDYGAVGDDGIDDTEALQAAIDAAAAAGGGTVYIPDGYYKVSTQSPGTVLVLKDNVSLQGQSLLVTLQLDEKTSTGDIDGIVHISGTNTSARNIGVDGFISTPYDGEASAWSIADGIKVTLDRIQAIGATGFGIDLRAEGSQVQLTNSMAYSNDGGGIIAAGLVNSTLSDDSVQDNGGTGLDVTGPLTVLDVSSAYNSDGIVLHGDDQGRAATLQASLSASNGSSGIVIDNAQGAVIDHARIFENNRSGIVVTNSEDTRIVSNEITSDAQYGTWPEILLEDSTGTLVQGNTIGDQITSQAERPTYGVEERGQSDASLIVDNFITGTSEGEVKAVGATTRVGNTAVVMTTFGTAGDDTISHYQTAYNTLVYGGGGRDTLIGGTGDDTLSGGAGADLMAGYQGYDTFRFTRLSDSYTTATASFADTITRFDASHDSIDVTVIGFKGLGDGHNGTLALTYSAYDNLTYLRSLDANAHGQAFELILDGNYQNSLTDSNFLTLVKGTGGSDVLHGTSEGRDTLVGGGGADSLFGRAGADRLMGGAGADRLTGGAGADTFTYTRTSDSQVDAAGRDQGRDLIVDFNGTEHDQLDLTALGFTGLGDGYGTTLKLSYDPGSNVTRLSSLEVDETGHRFQIAFAGDRLLDLGSNTLQFAVTDQPRVVSSFNAYADITGTSGSDVLLGAAGMDHLYGLAGNDRMTGGPGLDTLAGGSGVDRMTGGGGSDGFVFETLEDSYRTADHSYSDVITDFALGYDYMDVRALGFTGPGDGLDHTLKIDYSEALDRTYVHSLEHDDKGRFFQVTLEGNHLTSLQNGDGISFASAGTADAFTPVELSGVATASTDHAVG